MIVFMTHDQALIWDRVNRILAVMGAVLSIVVIDMLTPYSIGSGLFLVVFAGQILILKCWADMILKSQPFKNCWEFQE
jgi:hypothetical protein